MSLTTLVELHRSDELRSNLVEHFGSKFFTPFLESKQHCASSQVFGQSNLLLVSIRSETVAIFPEFSQFDTTQSIYFRNFHWSTRGRTLVFDLRDSICIRAPNCQNSLVHVNLSSDNFPLDTIPFSPATTATEAETRKIGK